MLSQLNELLGSAIMENKSVGMSPAIFRKRKANDRLTIINDRGLKVGAKVVLEHGGNGVIAEITSDYAIRIRGLRGSFHPCVVRRA